MPRRKQISNSFWILPMLLTIGLFIIYLVINVLPTGTFGTEWATIKLDFWTWMPWLLSFAIGLVVLKQLIRRGRY